MPQSASVGTFCGRPLAPRATYRVQLHGGFGFDQVAELADYFAALGVSHLYISPILQAAPGSMHGYDVVDPHIVNTELGGEQGFERLREALGRHHLGQVLDIVPNHMAISGRENAWWWDVLENGPSSRYATYFDIDWQPPESAPGSKLRDVVLMPILSDHFGKALADGQLVVRREGGGFVLRYADDTLPIAPRSLDTLLHEAATRTGSDDLAFLADAYANLPPASSTDTESVQRRHRDKEKLRDLLGELVAREPSVARALDDVVAALSADPVALDALLERQNYRLSYWRAAERELDYRRFFDINSLVGLRNEDPQVFADTHERILDWVERGVLDGLRVDHVDGLRDPDEYLDRLRERAPRAWIVVEKILEPGEQLPPSWPLAGTTGYDFLNLAGGLFVDSAAEEPMTRFYGEFSGQPTEYAPILREKKLAVLQGSLNSDVNRLTATLLALARSQWRYRDYTWHEVQDALREVIADFPVYRTYARAEEGTLRPDDLAVIEQAIAAARANRPDLDADLLAFLRDLLTLHSRDETNGLDRTLASNFVMRFQQLTGPAMAKGGEDSAFYCYNRLVSLNEVGGDPGRFGVSLADFHATCATTQLHWPQTMLATSTHDTKRSEDVRARISLLCEMPERWRETATRWAQQNARHWQGIESACEPDRNAEYLYYQTLVGAWPISEERAWRYMEKAIREAKQHTSWTELNPEYEARIKAFVAGTLGDREFVEDVERFVDELAEPWYASALAQTLLKLTAPGVPDLYQGSELWDLTLVDPDNRAPVDYDLRRRLLAELEGASVETIWQRRAEGLPKLHLSVQVLALRARRPELFGLRSTYEPLEARGAKAEHVIAFSRSGEVVAIAPRLTLTLAGHERGRSSPDWRDTTLALPPGRWCNELTGETLEVAQGECVALASILQRFPVALLAREPPESSAQSR
ncbi:MAG TPA: malto-oligosyltrehalose synthase [Ktedonobacterales bacterium]